MQNLRHFNNLLLTVGTAVVVLVTPFPVDAAGLLYIQSAIMQDDYPKAEKLARSFIAGRPPKAELNEALYYLGLSQLRQGDYIDARGSFLQLTQDSQDVHMRDRGYLGLIDSYLLDEQYPPAVEEANKLLSLNPQ